GQRFACFSLAQNAQDLFFGVSFLHGSGSGYTRPELSFNPLQLQGSRSPACVPTLSRSKINPSNRLP
ncbi:MAG TPA: hypothetical protein VNU49_02455, partial [Opitutaceae bacterium]|nr:hypothetical protein [Opitutaceae bacterium]